MGGKEEGEEEGADIFQSGKDPPRGRGKRESRRVEWSGEKEEEGRRRGRKGSLKRRKGKKEGMDEGANTKGKRGEKERGERERK